MIRRLPSRSVPERTLVAPTAVSRTTLLRIVGMVLVAGLLGGCDKCGNRVKFHAPSLPDSCGENADPAR